MTATVAEYGGVTIERITALDHDVVVDRLVSPIEHMRDRPAGGPIAHTNRPAD